MPQLNKVLFFIVIAFFSTGMISNLASDSDNIKIIPLYIGDIKFNVEVADTQDKWLTGMMYRETMADDFGMLFVSNFEDYRSFWMKNCLIHLDIIFLDSNKQVVNIHSNVPPCQQEPCHGYPSLPPAQYVLELRAKRAQELGLKPGDVISFSWKF